jgi:UDP-glucose:(heptosyl)LPS alpha-1,3-glucosyltransferase
MPKYKLAFIIERYFKFGGLQRDMRKFAQACAEAGHDVTVFTNRWDGPEERLFRVEIVNLKASSNHKTIKKIEKLAYSLKQKNEFDCIVGFNRMGGLDVYFGGDPCLRAKLKSNGRAWLSFLPRYHTYLQLEQAVFGPESDTDVMVISPTELETISRTYKIAPNRIHLLPPGIDRERLIKYSMTAQQRKEFRKQYGINDDGFLLLTIGSSFMTKGIDRAIEAIASLPENMKSRCRYIVIGQGDENKFQAIASKAGIGKNITFAGGREDIGAFYYASDLLLHPARTETAGHTLLESMVCSLPVIVTEHCGYARYVREAKGGLICPDPFVQGQLNKILKDFLDNKDARQQYGQNGFNYTETADIYSMTDKAVKIILDRAAKKSTAK